MSSPPALRLQAPHSAPGGCATSQAGTTLTAASHTTLPYCCISAMKRSYSLCTASSCGSGGGGASPAGSGGAASLPAAAGSGGGGASPPFAAGAGAA